MTHIREQVQASLSSSMKQVLRVVQDGREYGGRSRQYKQEHLQDMSANLRHDRGVSTNHSRRLVAARAWTSSMIEDARARHGREAEEVEVDKRVARGSSGIGTQLSERSV